MNKFIYFSFIITSFLFISCATTQQPEGSPKMGEKGGICYSNLTCNSSLICINMICENDPCYNVDCKGSWKTCEAGECKLLPNRCDYITDCSEKASTCDVNHNCVFPDEPCKNQNCSEHGKCFIDSTNNKPICNCNTGYNNSENPLECAKNVVIDLCDPNPCKAWETCDTNDGSCLLMNGKCNKDGDCTNGKICNNNECTIPVNNCEGVICSNHGECVINPNTNLATCNCDTNFGYFPTDSGLNCKNPCQGNENCGGYGTCSPTNATNAICTCENGYIASGLTCIENNLCTNNTCGEWEPCDPTTGACSLRIGRCNSDDNCTAGQTCDTTHHCVTPDLCENVVCQNNWEECRNGSCELISGMCNSSTDCFNDKPACVNNKCVDLCITTNLDCGSNGECLSDDTEAICVCNTGYTGDLCDNCSQGYQYNDNNGSCEPYTIWCNLQSPATITQEKDSIGELVFGRVYVNGITETTTQASPLIKSQMGYTINDVTTPIIESDYIWLDASYNDACNNCGNNDEYMVNFPTDMEGSYKYIYRVSIDNGTHWLYCDLNGVGGIASDPFEVNQVGNATITAATQPQIKTLFFSEIVDYATISNAKYVEIYNPKTSSISLNGWKIQRYANGNDTNPATYNFSDTLLDSNKTYVITNNMTDFNSAFGFNADDSNSTTISGNGNDVYVLINPAGETIDIYGVIGIDGTNTAWDYTDSVARRNDNISKGNSTWTENEWTITAGNDAATPEVR